MKKYKVLTQFLMVIVFVSFLTNLNAQSGLNFQGVARTASNSVIASQDITLKLSILQGSATGLTEYIEVRKVTTNAQGLFTAVIGDSLTISTLGKFSDIDWKLSPKFLKIELDPAAGNNFISMGTTQFQFVAYAKFANSVLAENISGIVPIARGGTGSNSLTTFKSNLALDKVNNTADSSKPTSKLVQAALDLKLSLVDSTKAYVTPTQLARYNLSSGGSNIDTNNLSNYINMKLDKSDTTTLSNRINSKLDKSDITNLSNRINLKFDITDTTTLSNRIDLKLNINDTASLFKKSDTSTLSNRINLKLTKSDTSTLSNRINYKLNIADTSSLLRKSQVGAINGAASLDATGKVPSVQIPAISFSSVDVVNSMAAMLSFTFGTGLPTDRLIGSIVVRLDSSKNFVLANLPASNRNNWIELVNPDAPVKAVNGLTGYIDLRKVNIPDLINVDNTSDELKPLSLAASNAFDLNANFADFYDVTEVKFDIIDKTQMLQLIGENGFSDGDKRELTKLNQWEKLHIFDDFFMQWQRVVYLDSGLRVLDDVSHLLELDYKGAVIAPRDGKIDAPITFDTQISHDNAELVAKLLAEYESNILQSNHMLNCVWIYDTDILQICNKMQLVEAMNQWPLCKTNEMTIMNLLLHFKYKLWKPFPVNASNKKILFDWCELNSSKPTTWRDYCLIKYPVTINFDD